jgi:signal transduction histidine kinase
MLGRLDHAFAAQRRLVADASHGLRNPLAIARTTLDVALDAPDPARVRRAAVVARRATDRMGRLVDDLLALARLEAPGVRRDPVDVPNSCASAPRSTAPWPPVAPSDWRQTRRKGSASLATARVSGGHSATWSRTPFAIRRRAGASGSRPARDGWVSLVVADEGTGIAAEDRARVFDRFYRADRARSPGGSGLGLAIVREIVEAHAGRVELASEPGSGSTFTLRLPRADATVSAGR